MSTNVTPIHQPHPVMLAMATGRITPYMVEGFMGLFDEDPNKMLSVLRATPPNAVIETHEIREAQAAEIRRFARQQGVSFSDAFAEIHRLATRVLAEPVYSQGPEAA